MKRVPVVGVIFALLGIQLECLTEAQQGKVPFSLTQCGLSALELGFRFEGALGRLVLLLLQRLPLQLEEIHLALPGGSQNLVGAFDPCIDLCGESLGGIGGVNDAVGVGELGQSTVGVGDLVFTRVAPHSENLEVVPIAETLQQTDELPPQRLVIEPLK